MVLNAPLGLPKGSVRAILTLLVVGAWAGGVLWHYAHSQPDAAWNLMTSPPQIVWFIVGFYFGQRERAKAIEEEEGS